MKYFKQTVTMVLVIFAFSAYAGRVQAQSNNDNNDKYRKAVQEYNKGNKLSKNKKFSEAIDAYKKAISEAQGGGDKAQKLIQLSKKQLPSLYYEEAVSTYKTFQNSQTESNLDNTISAFKDASNAASKYGNSSLKKRADDDITKLMYNKSVLEYSQKNYSKAMDTINKVINNNANYAKAYYQKALIYKKMDGHLNDAFKSFHKAIEVGKKTGDTGIVSKAKDNASGQLIYIANQQNQNKHYSDAINTLKRSLNYNSEAPTAYFEMAKAYNNLGKHNSALTYAKKGLQYDKGGKASKAKFYFEEGKAYQALNKKSSACNIFAKAAYGDFKDSADHIMKYELKCKGQQ